MPASTTAAPTCGAPGTEPRSSAGGAFHTRAHRSYLEAGAHPGAVPYIRRHTRQILAAWRLGHVADDVELVVSEIATNAVRATLSVQAAAPIALYLALEHGRLYALVWDASPDLPTRRDHADDAESGRGLELVSALAADWAPLLRRAARSCSRCSTWRGSAVSDPPEGRRFGYNVTAWVRAYPGYMLRSDGIGLIAWRRNAKGRASGRPIRARTLDELADLIDATSGNADPRALEGIGRCHLKDGRTRPGVESLRQALAIYQRIGSPYARRAETTLADPRLRPGDGHGDPGGCQRPG